MGFIEGSAAISVAIVLFSSGLMQQMQKDARNARKEKVARNAQFCFA